MAESKKTIGTTAGVVPAASTKTFRRIITGHDENGKAVVKEDAICPNRFVCGGVPSFVTNEMWRMDETPTNNEGDYVDLAANFALNPPVAGNVFRLLEIPPDSELGTDENGNPRSPDLHRTASIDYAFVVSGEIYSILDDGMEIQMKAGDTMIQRGTHHAWSNKSNEPAIVLFVLIGAKTIPGLPVD